MRICRKGGPKGRQTFAFCRTHLAIKGSCDSIVCVLICFFSPILLLSVAAFLVTMHSQVLYTDPPCVHSISTSTLLYTALNVTNTTLLSGINSSLIMERIIEESYARSRVLHPLTLLCTGLVRLSLCSLSFISSALPNFSFFLHWIPRVARSIVAICCCCLHCEFFNYELGLTHIQISTVFYFILN